MSDINTSKQVYYYRPGVGSTPSACPYSPVKISRGSAWFLSPMRQENEPSFKVHLFKNIWYDFGIGEGGNLIDLVMKLKMVNVPDALELISHNSYALGEQYAELSDEAGRIINRIQPLTNPALIQYLQSRRVSLGFCRIFLKEDYYTVHGKQYFAILNSLSFLPRIESTLKHAIALNLFPDNYPTGRTATYKINKKFREVKDWAPVIYPDHKDFNEFLMK